MSEAAARNLFISYAREDRTVAEALHGYLFPLIQQGKLNVFVDTRDIEKGDDWHQKITAQLRQADAVLLLVSQHYFRSEYVMDTELPAIVERYRSNELACWPFLATDYPWDDFVIDGFKLSAIQAIGPFDADGNLRPLNALPVHDQEAQLTKVYIEVRDWIGKLKLQEQQQLEARRLEKEAQAREAERLEEEARAREAKRLEEERRAEEALEREQELEREQAAARQAKSGQAENSDAAEAPARRDATTANASAGKPKPTAGRSGLKPGYIYVAVFLAVVAIITYQLNESEKRQRQEQLAMEKVNSQAEAERIQQAEADAKMATAEAEARQRAENIINLLATAERQIAADKLTSPTGDNALESIQAVREIQPANKRARELLGAILDRYLQLAEQTKNEHEFDRARKYLERARLLEVSSAKIDSALQALNLAKLRSSNTPAAISVFRDSLSSGGKGPPMVVIPTGSFMMGSPDSEPGREIDEGPQHEVHIQAFALGKTEVTFDQYDRFARSTWRDIPSDQGWGRGDRPVINVNWNDAVAYADWLSQQTGKDYRLPSESEWEYAARAGTTTRYSWGDDIDCSRARYGIYISECLDQQSTSPVESFAPNPFGLHDMHGNVLEWTQDCWHDTYEGAPADGSAWMESDGGNCAYRVMRSGGWLRGGVDQRSAKRSGADPTDLGGLNLGFRLARAL